MKILPNGETLVLTRKAKVMPTIHKQKPILDDSVSHIDRNGNELSRVSIVSAIQNSGLTKYMESIRKALKTGKGGDVLHTNFIEVVDEVTGEDWRWFFEETFFSSALCDYTVKVETRRVARLRGWFEGADGDLAPAPPPEQNEDAVASEWESRVTVIRKGGVRMPVEVRVELEDGRSIDERWDGRERWVRFRYTGAKVVAAVVDPRGKIAIDIDRANNEWIASRGQARRSATKWAARWMFWLQNFLELQMVVG